MGPLGWQETIFIFLLALLIFGPKKLPELGKTIGKAMTEFRRASSELKSTFDREMTNLERETEPIRQAATEAVSDSSYDSSSYSYDYDYGYGESTATDTSTSGATATQGAESTIATAPPEGTIAQGSEPEPVKAGESNGTVQGESGEAKPVVS
jgi:TatA/E family protein of Tat protein translocase